MTSEELIDLLEQRRLIAGGVARQLRAKISQGDHRLQPQAILKFLVKKDLVSSQTADELLAAAIAAAPSAGADDLGLAPLPDVDDRPAPPPKPRPVEAPPVAKAALTSKSRDDDFFVAPPKAVAAATETGRPSAAEIVETFPLGEEPADREASTRLPGKKKRKKHKTRAGRPGGGESQWDSPLVLIGGAGLALLLISGVVLYYLLTRENADLVLKEANEHFDSGSFQQAIHRYEYFVENWPTHEDGSHARVRLGIAKLRRDTEGGDYAQALATARQVIDAIENEPAFTSEGADDRGLTEGKRELSELLTRVAEGLAQQADAATDSALAQQRVEQINSVLALTANTKYVPDLLRQGERLSAVRETLDRVVQRQQRDADLTATLTAMDQAIAAGDTAAAFSARRQVIRKYPVLADDPSLAEKVLRIAAAEQTLVNFVAGRQPAVTDSPASAVVAEIALAERRSPAAQAAGAASGEGASPVVVRIDGALYALDPQNGALRWRRFVGLDGVDSYPLPLDAGRIIAADDQRGELICLDSRSGKLAWRQPLDGRLATPVLVGERLVVASDAGKLYVLDASTGELLGHVRFTQPLRVAPAVNEAGDRLYVVGEHSNLYTLATRDWACLGVHYLGHAAGGIVVPPLPILNKVAVADNSGAETCQVRLLTLNDQGAAVGEAASHRLAGLVTTPLHNTGRRFAAVTTRGQAIVFEVGRAADNSALAALAAREPQDREQLARYCRLHEGALWVAGRQLLKLAVLPTGNQLPVRSLEQDYRGDAFDYPLQTLANLLVHVRRPAGRGGAIVAALDAAADRPLWETELAVPPAGPPAVDASSLHIVSGASSGAVVAVDREAMTRRIQDQAVRADAPGGQTPPYSQAIDLGQGRLLLGSVGVARLLHYRPGDASGPLASLDLPSPLASPPVAWGDGFLVPTAVGQVFLYDSASGAPRGTPFQPELIPGQNYSWLEPAVAGSGAEARAALSDGRAKLHLLAQQPGPAPYLAAVAVGDVGPSPLASRLAIVGERVFAGTEAGSLANFAIADLAPGDPAPLGGRVTWGPFAAPGGVLAATDANELALIAEDGSFRWRQKLPRGDLAGTPLAEGDSLWVLYAVGGLARISLVDGSEAAYVELGQPALHGPVPFGQRLILTAPDGTLLVVNRP